MYNFKAISKKLKGLLSQVHYGQQELKFIKSPVDLKIFIRKCLFLTPRLSGFQNIQNSSPPSLQIEPTNFCNARCTSCSVIRSSRSKGYMDFALFKKIIDEAADIKIRRIHLYLHGEPMRHPQLIDMIKPKRCSTITSICF